HIQHPHLHPFPTRRSSDLTVRSPDATCNTGRGDSRPTVWAGAVAIEERRDDKVAALRDVVHALPNVLHNPKKLMPNWAPHWIVRSEEHTSELQSRSDLVCR